MKRFAHALFNGLFILSVMIAGGAPAAAHDARFYKVRLQAPSAPQEHLGPPPGISGQGNLRFRVLFTAAHLPEAAQAVLMKAHGGFAVDRRPGKGETYFALPGAGILQISADFQRIRLLPTAPEMKNVNLHGTTIWYDKKGRPFLVFPSNDMWNDLAFGGKGDAPTQFRTAHGITLVPGTKQFDISDRPHSEIKRFTRYGHYLGTLKMPSGSLPCDIDYLGHYAVVAALDGPDPSRGAPIYILEDGKLVSTIDPKDDLGLKNFKHIHNAVLRKVNNKLYIIVQAWNPGDFAILEQVTD